jgi:hypothetical protein
LVDNALPEAWCASATPIDASASPTDFGTPGAPNLLCALPQYSGSIQDLRDPTSAAYPGPKVYATVTGVVTASSALAQAPPAAGRFWVQDPAGGPYSGIEVRPPVGFDLTALVLGSQVSVGGAVTPFDISYYLSAETVTVTSTGAVPAASPVPLSNLVDQAAIAPWEGVLISLTDPSGPIQVTNANPDAPSDFNEFAVGPGLRVDDLLYLVTPDPTLGTLFTGMAGVMSHSFGNYKLLPRSAADIQP